MNKYLISLAYDGSSYSGWNDQPNVPTIQAKLNQAIYIVTKNKDFKTLAASKTDAKVHARDQKVLLALSFRPIKLEQFQQAINEALPFDIRITSIEENLDDNFNIRNVKEKTYSYTINNGEYNLFNARFELFWNKSNLDCNKLQILANLFVGTHDFRLFSGLKVSEYSSFQTIREIISIEVIEDNKQIKFIFKSKGFIRYQIRMIVGAILYCSIDQKISIDQIKKKLAANGSKSSIMIDGKGLCLEKITF